MTKQVQELDHVIIRFAGDSGDGMQLTGDRFTQETAVFGNDLSTLPNFPAEIRAPAGTLRAGERALDIATGLDAVVEKSGIADGLLPSDVQLRLKDGRRVVRAARDVLWRPTPPGA